MRDFVRDFFAVFLIAVVVYLLASLVASEQFVMLVLVVALVVWLVVWLRRRQQRSELDRRRNTPNPFENDDWRPDTTYGAEPDVEPPERRHRSPARLLYSAACERMPESEMQELRSRCGDALARLRRATVLLAQCQTQEAEGLCFVARGIVRRTFGEGKHWLEAIIIADIAALHHYRNQVDDAKHYFERAEAIGALWFDKYPWLRAMCTRRRLVRN